MSNWKKFVRNLQDTVTNIGFRQLATVASATAFWFFLSVVPMVILCASLLPFFPVSQEEVLSYVNVAFPSAFNQLLNSIVEDIYSSNAAVLSLSIVATIWSASVGFSALFRGLEDIYLLPHRTGFFLRRAKGILYTLGMTIALFLSIVLMGFGQRVSDIITSRLPSTLNLLQLIMILRYFFVLLFLTLFFMFIFKWSTRTHPRFVRTFPGALLSALLWIGLSQILSLWVNNFGLYSTYGRIATVVIVMLWLYYCQYVLLISACVNRALAKTFPKKIKEK